MVGNANANGIPFLKRYGIPPAIKNSMVLWYDTARQGATNESMAENPILKDLSGNGHDITCYNFAWSGMSGIGGYVFSRPLENWYKSSNNNGSYTTEGNVLHITKLNTNRNFYYITNDRYKYNEAVEIQNNVFTTKPFKIKISGLPENKQVKISGLLGVSSNPQYNTNLPTQYFDNGTYTVESVSVTFEYDKELVDVIQFPHFYIDSDTADDVDITIELLPEYPNALVSDGVDDYAYVEGLPILTDYTVIAKRKWLELSSNFIALASKTANVSNAIFLFEWSTKDLIKRTSSFGGTNTFSDWWNDIITYQTKREYNGTALTLKNEELTDTDNMTLLSLNRYGFGGKIALYSFLLFNRTLTKNEIEWVKTNLISVSTNE